MSFQSEKQVVRDYISALDSAGDISAFIAEDYLWRGMHPFYEREGQAAVDKVFWNPLRESFTALDRRMDFFFAGANDCDEGASVWVVNAGHFMGLFDCPWLGIPPTRRIAMLRYAEFHRVEGGQIAETALFLDILSVMEQAGVYPLPPQTGAQFVHPGPKTHDGLKFADAPADETARTLATINSMILDTITYNSNEDELPTPDSLRGAWHEDMIWYGPAGIGTSYTIPRYQTQHQHPFRAALEGKQFNGHVARLAEGNVGGFFGWPNLNNTNTGGFMGLPASDVHAPMRVVDLYRAQDGKLAENWVWIDLLHWLDAQGLDVLARNAALHGTEYQRPGGDAVASARAAAGKLHRPGERVAAE